MYSPGKVLFSVALILAILITVGCIATAFYFSPKRQLEQERVERHDMADRLEQAAERVEEALATPQPARARGMRVVTVTAPMAQFQEGSAPIGTLLSRGSDGTWRGGNLQAEDAEIEALLENDVVAPVVNDLEARLALLNTRFPAEEMAETFQALQNDFQVIAGDFQRAFGNVNAAAAARIARPATPAAPAAPARPSTPVTPAAVARSMIQPRPAKPTPKSAIDRLLEDEDLIDENSGVKPGT